MDSINFYTRGEEVANTITHAAGIVLGLIAGYILWFTARESGNGWAIGSIALYLCGMLFSYISSTSYHACTGQKAKSILRKLDHSAIYLHIAGTYAPFTLLLLRDTGAWGWSLFTFNWIAAALGLFMSFKKLQKHSHLETVCFIGMGCSILVAFGPLIEVLQETGQMDIFYWLVAGGISYIVGAIFYSWTSKRYMHTIFHLFVLVGSICHIRAIYLLF